MSYCIKHDVEREMIRSPFTRKAGPRCAEWGEADVQAPAAYCSQAP